MQSPLEEKMIFTLPATRVAERMYYAAMLLAKMNFRGVVGEFIREAIKEKCERELGEHTFAHDSAFGNLEDASQGNARLTGVK